MGKNKQIAQPQVELAAKKKPRTKPIANLVFIALTSANCDAEVRLGQGGETLNRRKLNRRTNYSHDVSQRKKRRIRLFLTMGNQDFSEPLNRSKVFIKDSPMQDPAKGTRVERFGAFEVNFVTGELRKHGIRLKIQEQPL